LYDFSQRKRREVSQPPKFASSAYAQKLFDEADLIVLEERKTSDVKSFKIFNDKQIFPDMYRKTELMPIN
jgi:hypothetical protein